MSFFQRTAERIDVALAWLKWPVAVVSVLLLWPCLAECIRLSLDCVKSPRVMLPFAGGAAMYVLVWIWVIRWWGTTLLSTLEHEITHAVFAVLTMHRITDLKTTWNSGGHISFSGRGNWLISLAPYFFPTICYVLIPVFACVSLSTDISGALIGATFAYHITSTIRETHLTQSDLLKEGYLFSVLFLPTANLAAHGLVVAFVAGGMSGTIDFLHNAAVRTQSLWSTLATG